MYVCICNTVTDHRIHDAVDAGATDFESLQETLGVSTCCGCCESEVREILAEHLKDKPGRHLRIVNDLHRARSA